MAVPVFAPERLSPSDPPVGYLGRYPGDPPEDKLRYKWPKDFPRDQVLFNYWRIRDGADHEPVVLVEGFVSVLRLHQLGVGAVASFGCALSDQQARLLIQLGRPIVLMYDGDEAGIAGSRQAAARTCLHGLPPRRSPAGRSTAG